MGPWVVAGPREAAGGTGPQSARPRSRRILKTEGEGRHLPVHGTVARASSSCSTQKPELQKLHGQPIPESFVKGKRFALYGYVFQGAAKASSARAASSPGMVRPAPGSPNCLPHFASVVDDVAFVRSVRDQRVQPRAGQGVLQHGLAPVRPAGDGVVGHLRAWQRIDRLARLRRPAVGARAVPRGGAGALWSSGFFCRRPIRECRSDPVGTRSSTCRRRPACPRDRQKGRDRYGSRT